MRVNRKSDKNQTEFEVDITLKFMQRFYGLVTFKSTIDGFGYGFGVSSFTKVCDERF
jgi:hypothetical protein